MRRPKCDEGSGPLNNMCVGTLICRTFKREEIKLCNCIKIRALILYTFRESILYYTNFDSKGVFADIG